MSAIGISYMGTKRELAADVAGVIAEAKPGRLLDAFAGMGAVAHAVGTSRPIWVNDVQRFAQIVGRCIFTARENPRPRAAIEQITKDYYNANLEVLENKNRGLMTLSNKATTALSFDDMEKELVAAPKFEIERCDYSCFLETYGGGFFSFHQAAQIDSVRSALDKALSAKSISYDQWRWGIVSLGRACLKVANTPGHFAQFLRPSASNFRRVQKQWQRDIWEEWLNGFDILRPVGTARWRYENIATNEDSLLLLTKHHTSDISVVYCDPPYTADQYSRYYHVWETMINYDYPETTGAGRYRSDRFTTPFSIKTKCIGAMRDLIEKVSNKGADLVLSYPTNGLLYEAGENPIDLLQEKYKKVELKIDLEHKHSTFGASKGRAKEDVRECIYLAQNCI
jgi:adenine-specific DNA-methyltransferase